MKRNTRICLLMISGIVLFGLGTIVQGSIGIQVAIGTMFASLGFLLFGVAFSLAPSQKPPDSAEHRQD